jgi:hypothetical protein
MPHASLIAEGEPKRDLHVMRVLVFPVYPNLTILYIADQWKMTCINDWWDLMVCWPLAIDFEQLECSDHRTTSIETWGKENWQTVSPAAESYNVQWLAEGKPASDVRGTHSAIENSSWENAGLIAGTLEDADWLVMYPEQISGLCYRGEGYRGDLLLHL